ncbi:MAG: efflux RND transporter permease subunit, partial [Caulobacterales bacterium]
MAWNISASAIRNPTPVIMLFLALIGAGLMSFFQLPINQTPDVELPTFTVTTSRPGAAPAEMEAQVAQKIESALSGIDGVKRITTTINTGVAVTTVELWDGVDLSRAVDDARNDIATVRADLPDDILEPTIARIDFAAIPIGYFAVESRTMSPEDLAWYVENDLSRQLLAVSGVSRIERFGGANREIRVELDPEKMRAFGATPADVNTQLLSVNVNAPGGRADISGNTQTVRTIGEAKSVEDLAATSIILPGGLRVRLSDIADVRDASDDPTVIGRYNGRSVVGFGVSRAKSASAVGTFDRITEKLEEIGKQRSDVKIFFMANLIDSTRAIYESSLMSILEGAVLAVIVVMLVLRDWRATLISAAAIPLSIIPTFFVMHTLGFTLNFMTLMGLGLVVGVLVDDAIVEVENIVRHMRMGKRPFKAALEAADEIGLAVVATSCVIMAVFVPVAFMPGVTGQFFRAFGVTIAVSVFFSLLVARLITPMMAAFFLKDTGHEDKPSKLRDRYMKTLSWSLRRPWMTAGAGLAVFIGSLMVAATIPTTLIPRMDEDFLQVRIEFSPGTTMNEADV